MQTIDHPKFIPGGIFMKLVRFLALIFCAFALVTSTVQADLDDIDFASLAAGRDTLVDVHCPECDNFESRRLEVLKDAAGTMTALRFSKIKSGTVTDTVGPNQLKSGLVPMYEQSGFTVIQLDARLVNPEKGGKAVMIWYGNVLTNGGRESLDMVVEQGADGLWGLYINGAKIREFIITPARFGVDTVSYR